MLNKVTKKECIEAIEYLHVQGFVEEMTSDKKHYVKTLLNKVEKHYNLSNNWVEDQDCIEAIEYLHVQGFVEEMTSDKKYYVEILLKKVANDYNLNLGL